MLKKMGAVAAISLMVPAAHADAQMGKFSFNMYGFLKASYITADAKVSSYGFGGVGAITQAEQTDETNAATKKSDEERRHAFQSMQSRFGFKFNHGGDVSGKLEFDFINFNARQPSPNANIRLRLAQIDYKMGESTTFSGGQKWVTWMGVVPHTYNYVQSNFLSGHTGFIAQEMAIKHVIGDFDLYGAVGSRGVNNGVTVSENDRGWLPQASLRADYNYGMGLVGFAVTGSKLEGESDPANTANTYQDGNAFLGKVYGSFKNDLIDFRAEYFVGQNTANLHALATEGSAFGANGGTNVKAAGGFSSAKFAVTKKNGLYAGYGFSETVDGEKNAAVAAGTNGSGTMIGNKVITAGVDHKTESGLIGFLETQMYDTEYKTAANAKKSYDATTIEAGFVYKF
ncbi:MAG: hypothetical protein K9K67_14480 [Bacteriovoracaceae bacterium]|nr:hypothetical protein [Bacteriovoracaceae bacterium]